MANRTEILLLIGLMLVLAEARVIAGHWSAERNPYAVLTSDSLEYESTALALIKTGRFAVSPNRPNEPQIRRTPGYPVFIVLVYAVFGQSRAALLELQAIASVLILPLVFFLARERWGRKAAWAATLILALDPISFLYSGKILSETLFTLFLVSALFAATKAADERRSVEWSFAAGLALSLAALVRPIAFYLIIPLVVWLAVVRRKRGGDGAAAWAIIAIVLPWFVLVGGWQVRNYMTVGRPVLSSIGELNQFDYRAAGVISLRDGIPIQEARRRLRANVPQNLTPDEFDRWMGEEGMRIVLENKLLAARMTFVGAIKLLFGPPQSGFTRHLVSRFGNFGSVGWMANTAFSAETWRWLMAHPGELAFAIYVELHTMMMYILALVALWLVWRRPRLRSVALDTLLWGTILYFVAISSGPEANPRFRVPIVPAIAVLAGGGFKRVKGEG